MVFFLASFSTYFDSFQKRSNVKCETLSVAIRLVGARYGSLSSYVVRNSFAMYQP